MCKEQMAVAPLLAILYDWTFPRGRRSRLFYLALFACWIILPIELSGVDLDSKSGYGLKYVAPFDYLETQALVICHYLRLCFWPSGLVIDYTDWPIVHGIGPAVLPGALIVALLGASVYLVILRRWEGFAGVWFFLILAPTSSVLPNFTEIAAERRMYLASVPVVVLTLAALPWKKALTPVLVLLLMIVTIARNEDYRSSIAIWSDAVAKRPENWHAHYFLARAYVDASNWEAARREDEIAIDLQPNAVAPRSLEERIRNRE
jgi:protein O-mannosyl-transferase